MSVPPELEYRQQLIDLMRGYRQAQLLITCAELGIFDKLGQTGSTVEALCQSLEVNPRALARLLNATVAMGLLEKEGEIYRCSPLAAACLAYESKYYLGNLVKREGAFYRRWSNLAQAVRTGQRPAENTRDEAGANWVRDFELALYDAARTTAPAVAEVLEPFLPSKSGGAVRVIDIGGGHGAYSLALARRYQNLEAIVFELPAAAEVAREIITASPLADRVTAQAGDFRTDELGQDFDLALLFGVLVSETPDSAKALLQKVYRSLGPGGWLVIRGMYLNPDRTGPPDATLADLHMLLSTEAGAAHALDEVTGWLEDSGFDSLQSLKLPAPERSELLLARKPDQ